MSAAVTPRSDRPSPPMIGALLRLPHEAVLGRLHAACLEKNHDLSSAELSVFLYPGPDGRRPSDLARQCGVSRQSMNYLLSGLEQRGYLERHRGDTAASTEVRLTKQGQAVFATLRATMREVEAEWTGLLGARRFAALKETLQQLAEALGKLPAGDLAG